jgi:carboxypeptidase Taq
MVEKPLEKLRRIDQECRRLERVSALLQWDQETFLPPLGAEERSDQLALLQGMIHERLTDSETGRLLEALGAGPDNPRGDEKLPALERDFLRVLFRKYDRAAKLPADFVTAAAKAEGLSQAAWVEARRNDDFAAFLPHLAAMIDFARKRARFWGFGGGADHVPSGGGSSGGNGLRDGGLYDGLLDIYEPGMPASRIDALFGPLRDRLSALLKNIRACPPPDTAFLDQDFDTAAQARLNGALMDYLGFDRNRGRLDTSAHPFTTTLGDDDVRITTRYFPRNLLSGIFSVIHESGHAFYEMGFPGELRGTSLADGCSMALHESQSRFWENVIGRSRSFWEGFYPVLRDHFPGRLRSVGLDAFYAAVNRVTDSPIRVDADEVSYTLHIILRFELEKRLISGELDPARLPAVWREYTRKYLGHESETDADGVLQDVHWSMGSFGYFPSYALGNLYGLQIAGKLRQDLGDFDVLAARGRFAEIRDWLGDRIYRWGCRLEPVELLMKVTGEVLSAEPFVNYIEKKYGSLYGI